MERGRSQLLGACVILACVALGVQRVEADAPFRSQCNTGADHLDLPISVSYDVGTNLVARGKSILGVTSSSSKIPCMRQPTYLMLAVDPSCKGKMVVTLDRNACSPSECPVLVHAGGAYVKIPVAKVNDVITLSEPGSCKLSGFIGNNLTYAVKSKGCCRRTSAFIPSPIFEPPPLPPPSAPAPPLAPAVTSYPHGSCKKGAADHNIPFGLKWMPGSSAHQWCFQVTSKQPCNTSASGMLACCNMDLDKVELLIKPQCRNTITSLMYNDIPRSPVYAVQQGNTVMRFTNIGRSHRAAPGTTVCFTLSKPGCDSPQKLFAGWQGKSGATYAMFDTSHKCCGYNVLPFQ